MGKIIYKSKNVSGRNVQVEKIGQNSWRCAEYTNNGPFDYIRDKKTDYVTDDVDDAMITGKAMYHELFKANMRRLDDEQQVLAEINEKCPDCAYHPNTFCILGNNSHGGCDEFINEKRVLKLGNKMREIPLKEGDRDE